MDDFRSRESQVISKARKLIRDVGVSSIPIDIKLFAAAVGARIKIYRDMDADEAGQTTQIGGKHLIMVNGNHQEERQRFTVLHEIAHIFLELPSQHHGSKLRTDTLMRYKRRPPEEILCDVFAAECLLPYNFFSKDIRNTGISMAVVKKLAEKYKASLTATGSRFAFNVNEPCAFVLSEAGQVRYVSRSKSLKDIRGWIRFKMPLPKESVAFRLTQNPSETEGRDELASEVWFDSDIKNHSDLIEEAIRSSEWDQCLSLISFECTDYDEEEPLLEELDGIPPWSSTRRRK